MSKKAYSVSEFKAKSLGLLERVARHHESIVITKRGRAIAKVIPFGDSIEKPEPGKLEGTVLYEEDIVSPLGAKLWKAAE
ncbi:MAG: type II toxin-antitoxin system Phd/YefM family antitoxin [Bdellovibrionota bacterium]